MYLFNNALFSVNFNKHVFVGPAAALIYDQ